MNPAEHTYTFFVTGMHCQSCVLLTESELSEYQGVTRAHANLSDQTVTITGTFGDKSQETIATELSALLQKHGYSVSGEKQASPVKWQSFRIALPVALLFVIAFIMLQKTGFISLVDTSTVSYGTVFLIGIVASLSSCMAVVGGLVLSLSATFAKGGDSVRPQLLFHVGRLVSFFLLGGVIGAIGTNFTLSTGATFGLGLIIGLVMLILGINLLEVFPWAKKWQLAMPQSLSKRAFSVTKWNHMLTPLLAGVATFFLPCGFTQSMQLYTLSSGSFLSGAATMLTFALGTLPVLALVSFSSFHIGDGIKKDIFFKTAGLVVIFFALFNIVNSFVIIGLLPPIFNF